VAAGFPGEQVDGNDVIAVRAALEEALARARAGGGPTLVEALTYRLSDHTTADDATRYRDDAEVSARWKEEPLARLRAYLVEVGSWGKEDEEALLADCDAQVEAAVEAYLATPPLPPQSMFDHLHAELPRELEAQRRALARTLDEKDPPT
jgi:pyruvate dehydrogenase E1 component alpha subunit